MRDESFEALAAFLDNEPVDPDEVARLLARPEGQAALLDFALLKAGLQQQRPMPRAQFSAALQRQIAVPRRFWRRAFGPSRLVAAAVLVVTALAGFWLGSSGSRARDENGPPVSKRVMQFQRGVDWHLNPYQEER